MKWQLTTLLHWSSTLYIINKADAAPLTLPQNSLLSSFLYSLGKPTGDSKSGVSEVAHTARETVFSVTI